MALISFSDDGRRGNSVEICRNKLILSNLAVHLLCMLLADTEAWNYIC